MRACLIGKAWRLDNNLFLDAERLTLNGLKYAFRYNSKTWESFPVTPESKTKTFPVEFKVARRRQFCRWSSRLPYSVFTYVASDYANLLELKKVFTQEKSSNPIGLAWYTNMAAVLFYVMWKRSVLSTPLGSKGGRSGIQWAVARNFFVWKVSNIFKSRAC